MDFAAFRRGFDPAAGAELHQEGVERIVRGLIQLLFYRLVYQLAALPIEAVQDAASGVRHLVTNVLLIVRIMGMFHVSVGILHLFGFRLPPTTHLPFFSPGFSEFWRRANVYWRDFVVKVFFYPAYFQLKGLGRQPATVLAILATFAAAWFLHSYQWFWFKGHFPLRWQDGAYWASFGVLVATNGLLASRRVAPRRRPASTVGVAGELVRGAKIAGTFGCFAILWSVWMTPSLAAWLELWAVIAGDGVAALGPIGVALGGVALLGVVWPDASPAARGHLAGRGAWADLGRPWRRPSAAGAALAGLLVLAAPWPAGLAPDALERALVAMRETGANVHDRDRQTEGYYQELAEVPRLDSPELLGEAGKPRDWRTWKEAGLARAVADIRGFVFVPSTSGFFEGAMTTTNSWGMRDQEYTREKAPGVLRIAVLGASPVAGSGVPDGRTFEALVERRLAEDREARGLPRVEILNFAVPGFRPVKFLYHLEHEVLGFDPDWVVVAATSYAWRSAASNLVAAASSGVRIDPPALGAIADACVGEAGSGRRSRETLSRCLQAHTLETVAIVAERMAELSREHGFGLAWLRMPTVGNRKNRVPETHRPILEGAGFVLLDAGDVFAGHPRESLKVAPWDLHPNVLAHELIAERMFALLAEHPEILAPRPEPLPPSLDRPGREARPPDPRPRPASGSDRQRTPPGGEGASRLHPAPGSDEPQARESPAGGSA